MKVKIIDQEDGDKTSDFEESVNWFLRDVVTVNVKIHLNTGGRLRAVILYKHGNQ